MPESLDELAPGVESRIEVSSVVVDGSGRDDEAAASSSKEEISRRGFFRWALGPNVSEKASVSTI